MINNAHSLIIDYPIDYDQFPLAKNNQIFKVELNKNEFLTIPLGWFHWIYTEPNTIAVSYEIANVNFKVLENNHFYNSFKFSNPYKGTNNINIDINYNEFINSTLNHTYRAIISDNSDCSPVIKNNQFKFFYENTLENIISIHYNKFKYIGMNTIKNNTYVDKYKHINTIIEKELYYDIYYKSNLWFSLDKIINSGLHSDPYNNIMFVLTGKKTIYLLNPNAKPNLYIRDMYLINYL